MTRYGDLILAFLVVCIIGLLIVPLPSPVVDGLISINICISAVLLMLSLYLPRIIPVDNTIRLGFNLPFRLSLGVTDAVKNPVFSFRGKLYLFTWEIQKSLSWLGIYLQHLDLTFTYDGSLRMRGWEYRDSYALGAKLSLTPLVGYLSSVAISLNGSVTYTVTDGFRFTWSFGLGE